MHHVRQRRLPLVGSSHELWQQSRAMPVFRYSGFTGTPVRGTGPAPASLR
jgi:hypothetical protein